MQKHTAHTESKDHKYSPDTSANAEAPLRLIESLDDDVEMNYENHYKCERCDVEWEDTWDSMCDDECPECGTAISPYHSIELKKEG